MLTPTRLSSALAATALLGVLLPSPASADGTVVCDSSGFCWVIAEDGGSSGGAGQGPGPSTGGESDAEAEPECEVDGETLSCAAQGSTNGAGATPAQVAAMAIELLPIPVPAIGLAPEPGGTALVGIPVWMWLDDQAWAPVSRTASAGSVSITATATPDRVEWAMGDGTTTTCFSAGVPYTSDASSSCTHTYGRASRSGPYTITATVHWDITWSGSGASGGQSLAMSATSTLNVRESQAIVQ
ncbi:hypothetical protein MRI28_17505 [Nocardiopsis dassonvillei]|uniref:hypothetical protein n=1 Tax=Nocardiopsis dassonvillei TaxID=2014 RepID=UPI00200F3ACC|nr:hypothetical protein [Nocardiopsis dassonvillei]MCK9871413.1 hypothetical protein [Nocardiopsis dassonvillei]